MGFAPGAYPCCCLPVPMAPAVPCCKENTYCIDGGYGGVYRFKDKNTAFAQCMCCGCIQCCDLPCGYVRAGMAQVAPGGGPAQTEMER